MVENRLLGDTVGSVDLCEEIDAVGECGVGPAGGEELEEWLREGDTWRENSLQSYISSRMTMTSR